MADKDYGSQPAHNNRAIDYIEFNVTDITRAKEFYGKAFGWTFTDYGPVYCEFSDGHMKGGFDASTSAGGGKVGAPSKKDSTAGPLIVLYGADLPDMQKRIEDAGGKIVKPIFEFPGGRRFHFTDPDGYELAVWSEA